MRWLQAAISDSVASRTISDERDLGASRTICNEHDLRMGNHAVPKKLQTNSYRAMYTQVLVLLLQG